MDSRLGAHLSPHTVRTAAEMGWEQLLNGELLARAAADAFDAVLTTDQNIKHQQNPRTIPVSIVILITRSNRLADLLPLVPEILVALSRIAPRQIIEVGAAR